MAEPRSSTHQLPFSARPSSHPLTSYLFRLMLHKQSNLCLSADVTNAQTLLSLAASAGPSIVVLKTHYDIINDWDSHPRNGTGAQLAKLARQHGFLIFEDRKFSDIGSTVQKQYTDGPGKIVEWAHITNAHILPGAAIVTALDEAARKWRERKNYEVKTNITAGTPRPESLDSEEEVEAKAGAAAAQETSEEVEEHLRALSAGRKSSIVSITTVSQHFEPVNSPRAPSPDEENVERYPGIEEAPLERGLLLLAQMSSAGNLLDRAYTQQCVEIAREHTDFVMGYIAQESLNSTPRDQFLTMTPGCQLPPEETDHEKGTGDRVRGDGLGQQYNTPEKLVGEMGTDIVIVGRGIIKAEDPVAEAERYRKKAWEAYEGRIKSA